MPFKSYDSEKAPRRSEMNSSGLVVGEKPELTSRNYEDWKKQNSARISLLKSARVLLEGSTGVSQALSIIDHVSELRKKPLFYLRYLVENARKNNIEKKEQILIRQKIESLQKNARELRYYPGKGVVFLINETRNDLEPLIEANNFNDCVFVAITNATRTKLGVLHVSPIVLHANGETIHGGDFLAPLPENQDYQAAINKMKESLRVDEQPANLEVVIVGGQPLLMKTLREAIIEVENPQSVVITEYELDSQPNHFPQKDFRVTPNVIWVSADNGEGRLIWQELLWDKGVTG